MIPVAAQVEPTNFDSLVRQPGAIFLANCPQPKSKDFKGHDYWRRVGREMYEAYQHICAYTGRYIETPNGSIDHFVGKTTNPDTAYEWSNFRLCLPTVNNHKGSLVGLVDPFLVQHGWFVLDFPSCFVRPGNDLSHSQREQVNTTITGLKLNADDSFVQDRSDIMVMFAQQEVTLAFLKKRRPFLAAEVVRQGIDHVKAAQLFKSLV